MSSQNPWPSRLTILAPMNPAIRPSMIQLMIDMCCLPFELCLETVRHLAAALGKLCHDLLVQPDIHFRRAIESAGVAEFLRQLLAGAKAAVQFQRNTCGSGKQRAPCHRSRSLPSRHLNMVPRIRIRRQGSCQASAEHFQQCAEFLLLRNRGLGTLTVTVLSVALFTVSPSDWAHELFPYRIVNAPALRRRARGRGGRVAEDCVMTTTSIFLDRLTAEVPTQTWKSFPKRWRAIRRLGRRRRRRSRNDQYFSLLLSQSILTLREPHIVNWGRQRCADSALVK